MKNKKYILLILIIIILLSIIFIYLNNRPYNYTSQLLDQNYEIVYDKVNTNKDKVPHININSEVATKINNEIDKMYEEYNYFSPDGFSYNYSISKNILSIVIKAYVVKPESTHYDIIYKSYNIDLKNNKLLTNKEVLNKFNITEDKMEFYLYNKFLNYYNDLIKNNYFTEKQCDFNCFLQNKNVENLLDDNNYYINNNNL